MKSYFKTDLGNLYEGDCIKILKEFPDNYFTSVITDPPYDLKFMGKKWDSTGIAFRIDTWKEILRVSKPGAILLAFGGTRTVHRLVCAIEDAGWEIRDGIEYFFWIYGSGFPKSLDISKAIDKEAGEYIKGSVLPSSRNTGASISGIATTFREKTASNPQTESAKLWEGYGTALKPAHEPICFAMKPIEGTFANNAIKYGVAGINVDGGRVQFNGESDETETKNKNRHADFGSGPRNNKIFGADNRSRGDNGNYNPPGRWPANVIHDGSPEVVGLFPDSKSCNSPSSAQPESKFRPGQGNYQPQGTIYPGDSGSAARFFYTAKASKSERGEGNTHPTVKPLALIKYLVNLVNPPKDGHILDPFIGSGTLALICEKLGIKYTGIDLDCQIAAKRIKQKTKQAKLFL